MGLFDRMLGSTASPHRRQDVQHRVNELKLKYQSVFSLMEEQQVQLQNLHVQDNKLFIKATVASQDAKEKIWNHLDSLKDHETDLICDISIEGTRLAGGSW